LWGLFFPSFCLLFFDFITPVLSPNNPRPFSPLVFLPRSGFPFCFARCNRHRRDLRLLCGFLRYLVFSPLSNGQSAFRTGQPRPLFSYSVEVPSVLLTLRYRRPLTRTGYGPRNLMTLGPFSPSLIRSTLPTVLTPPFWASFPAACPV